MIGWLKREPQGFAQTAALIAAFLLFDLGLNVLLMQLQIKIGVAEAMHVRDPLAVMLVMLEDSRDMALHYVSVVFKEELVFRFLPLGLAVGFLKEDRTVIAIALLSSAAFGSIHWPAYLQWTAGLGGVFYSILFLKCGGWNGKLIKPFCICMFAHYMWDTVGLIASTYLQSRLM